ncbi:MAG TPA: hypothetical protein VNB90_02210 [Cytophagaceae bacterium]|nr:hypothetical protein [Cytophagaceae bacterium]
MKKLILSSTLLVALATSACKKTYECTCTQTRTSSETAVMSQYQTDVDTYNANQADNIPDSDQTVTTIDKTSKGKANLACTSSEETTKHTTQDSGDRDHDSDYLEAAYVQTTVTKTDCSIEKKK